jgi:hypothetical protein
MKKLILTDLVVAIDLAPAFALAQPSGGGTSRSGTSGSGTSGTGSSGGNTSGSGTGAPSTSPGTPSTGPSNTPGAPTPGSSSSGSSTNPSVERATNKADCERVGGKWQVAQKSAGWAGSQPWRSGSVRPLYCWQGMTSCRKERPISKRSDRPDSNSYPANDCHRKK